MSIKIRHALTLLCVAAGCVGALAAAGAQTFGQNRVPGAPRVWRVLAGDHIDLHFYEEEREVAQTALRIAERAYTRLSRIHGYAPKRRIPVLLYSSQGEFSETPAAFGPLGEETGGLTESFKRRVMVPATGSIAELDHVLSHEIEHAFQIDILQGGGPGAQGLRWAPPLWVMEGLAEYLSVPGLDSDTEMWLRDAALEGGLIDLAYLSMVGDMRVYRFGQAVAAYIAERFGDEALGLWWRAVARRHSLERGTSESIGMTLAKLSEDWQTWVRRRYLPDLARREMEDPGCRRLTDHRESLANYHVIPALSPDGGELVYIANPTPYADIFLASGIDGSHARRIIRGAREETFESLRFYRSSIDWHPQGNRLALIARSGGRDRLTIFDVRRREVVASYAFGLDEMLSPVWSPDGERLAFVGLRAGRSRLYTVSAQGTGLTPLTSGEWAALQPAWSHDGTRIAFVTDEGHVSLTPAPGASPWRIAILDLAGGQPVLLPGAWGKNINPQWFPDNRHLAYVSDRDRVSNLFVHDLETGADYALTDLFNGLSGITPNSAAISLSDDGRRLVFSAYRDGGWDLFAIKDPLERIADREPWSALEESAVNDAASPDTAAPAEGIAPERPGADALAEADSLAIVSREALQPAPADSQAVADSDSTLTFAPIRAVQLAQLFAETAAWPESTACRDQRYRPRLSIDYLQAGGLYASGYGAIAQTVIGLSDMLGNRNLMVGVDVNGALEEGNYYVGYLNQARRPSISVAAYQYLSGYGYGTTPGTPDIYMKRVVRGVGAGLLFPLSHFRRLELYVDAVHETRFRWECQSLSSSNLWRCDWRDEDSSLVYIVPEIAYVHDSALFGSTGPLSGRRSRISAGVYLGDRSAHGLEADYRFYWNIRKRYAVAVRAVFAGEWGSDRQPMAFGGPYSLRGYSEQPLYGTSLAFTNIEFRFPFIEDLQIAWPLALGLYGIRGALFCDLGAAWDDPHDLRAVRSGKDGGPFRLEDIHASCGLRASVNLGFTVLRWDLARRTDFSRWLGKPKGEVSIGWEF